jgi:hypothetical protein
MPLVMSCTGIKEMQSHILQIGVSLGNSKVVTYYTYMCVIFNGTVPHWGWLVDTGVNKM